MRQPDLLEMEQKIREALAGHGRLTERAMMGTRVFMVDGAMCCSLGKRGLLVRVPKEERERVLEQAHVTPMKMGKRVMSGFVRVAPEGFRTRAQLKRWVGLGLAAARASSSRSSRPRLSGAASSR